jgi:uncharacterized protein involved in exopolysaccharide biosynthesis
VLVFTLLGVTYALLAPKEFTSEARVVREAQTESGSLPGGVEALGGLAGGAISGILGGTSSGLTPEAFPEVLQSREVKLAVARDTFRFPDTESPMTFVEYVNRSPGPLDIILKYTVGLPWTLKEALNDETPVITASVETTNNEESSLTEDEDEALKVISDMVSSFVDEETGLMTISTTASGPKVAANLTQSFIWHLKTRVREIRTGKVRERLKFVRQRFREANQELEKAENQLAQFLERNQNPTTASLQFRRDRLRRQVSFKEQLYSDLQGQLTQTQLDLQRQQPVVTVVEKPEPPIEPSAPNRILIVLMSFIIGTFVGTMIAFGRFYLREVTQEGKQKEKIEEIKKWFNIEKEPKK